MNNKEIKCKICGCVFIGIVVFANLSICKKCLKHMHDAPDIIRNEPQTQMREYYASGLSATSSTITEIKGLDFNQ